MIIIEYMKHTKDSVLVDPDWVIDGGHFPLNNTWIGLIPEIEDRKFYIPDQVITLSISEFKERLTNISFTALSDTEDPHSEMVIVDSDIIADNWWELHMGTTNE